ncbi:MAG: hypothetical protein RL189_718 [Pseudomonadota bacterium]
MQRGFERLIFLSLCLTLLAGCKSTSVGNTTSTADRLSANPALFMEQYESSEFSRCIDDDGKTTGSLNAIWRVKNTAGREITPYIESFSGKVRTLKGELLEFQSFLAVAEKNFVVPQLDRMETFPRGSYSAFKIIFTDDDVRKGLAIFRLNGITPPTADFATAVLYIPRFAVGGEYSTKYYLQTHDKRIHELGCQAVNDTTREQLVTFAAKDGLHEYNGPRGRKNAFLTTPVSPRAVAASGIGADADDLQMTKETVKDLRPANRPQNYDKLYRHTRLFECDAAGSLDAIWRVADEKGKKVPESEQYITGFAGELNDKKSARRFTFNAVSVDSQPAFYSGKMPPAGKFFFPSIEFREEDIKNNTAGHSQLGKIDADFVSGGGTVFIPRNGSGKPISVSLSLGKSLRGEPYQVTIPCKPVRKNISAWMNHCLGYDNRKSAGTACQP